MLPRLGDAHPNSTINDKNADNNFILMFYIIIYLPLGGNSFYNSKKGTKDREMALTVQNFIKLANYYNQTAKTMSAICVQKGGIAMENYVGRFYMADVLEFVVEYGHRLVKSGAAVTEEIVALVGRFEQQYERVRDLTTPSQKPIHEMTLAEFEKVMNI